MGLQILSTAWGKAHIELLKKTAIKSLSWDNNQEALTKAETIWNIYTDEDEVESLDKFSRKSIPGIKFNIQSRNSLRNYIDENQSATIWQMERSIESGDKVLLAPPDTIFGDGTIEGLLAAGRDEGSVVVTPHPRVLPTILSTYKGPYWDLSCENWGLVDLAWTHLHESWIHAEIGHPNQSSYMGGIWWERVNGLIMGKHLLPSPYLIGFTKQDLEYFDRACSFGHFDWRWPGDILIPQGRQRYIGSSDLAFIVEITEAHKNVPPIYENQPKTGFHRDDPHNRANNQIVFTFRGSQ